jgi:ATP-binding cassette subfamily B (MDR/TAP) protein 1
VDCRLAVVRGIGFSCFFFAIYAVYGLGGFDFLYNHKLTDSTRQYLAFSFGATLINQGHADPGQIANVIMAILIGLFSFAMIAPEMQGTSLSFYRNIKFLRGDAYISSHSY